MRLSQRPAASIAIAACDAAPHKSGASRKKIQLW
jgi:hypothetical protein